MMFDQSEEKTFEWGLVSLAMIVTLFLFLLGYAIWNTERMDASSDKSVKAMMDRPIGPAPLPSGQSSYFGEPGGSVTFPPI